MSWHHSIFFPFSRCSPLPPHSLVFAFVHVVVWMVYAAMTTPSGQFFTVWFVI